MGVDDRLGPTGDAQTDVLLRQAALRRGSTTGTSPPAVEATLLSISEEVMQDAIARLDRAKRTKSG